ncbi:MAG: hypothetical protein FWG81_10865 [Betaproteobacteria bacterium]|nr:hypothetical protein [Betaproteobacteria bacterium]
MSTAYDKKIQGNRSALKKPLIMIAAIPKTSDSATRQRYILLQAGPVPGAPGNYTPSLIAARPSEGKRNCTDIKHHFFTNNTKSGLESRRSAQYSRFFSGIYHHV